MNKARRGAAAVPDGLLAEHFRIAAGASGRCGIAATLVAASPAEIAAQAEASYVEDVAR